ncbi:hypothetical protein ACFOOP_05730 [Marinicaulis aureus]|uniref:Uncharacterized protein n=1 Tax=Hyphococcus aureus TaxID=2666033 RepID=A0ABW1KTW5_9PROT
MTETRKIVTRVQTGVRIEKRILKTLKIIAAHKELSLGDLLEGIVLHAFEGKPAFGDETLKLIAEAKKSTGLDLTADDSHLLDEKTP